MHDVNGPSIDGVLHQCPWCNGPEIFLGVIAQRSVRQCRDCGATVISAEQPLPKIEKEEC